MKYLTLYQLQAVMPGAGSRAASFLDDLNDAIDMADLNTPHRLHMFLAIIAHETGDLTRLQENLNYSAEALQRTWPTRFRSVTEANIYARQPEKIANKVYANRMGNGDEASGDGWRYRGAGAIQLTGKVAHSACARYFTKTVEYMPTWLATPEGAMLSAAWFWKTRNCNDYADHNDFDGICDVVNIGRKTSAEGDAIGFIARLAKLRAIQEILKG